MRTPDLGQLIGILANLGVIAGIIFLAVEIQQNNQLLRAEAISSVLETRLTRQELVIGNDSLVDALAKTARGEPLSLEEMMRLEASMYRNLLGNQRDYFLYREGILSEEEFRANFPIIRGLEIDNDSTYSVFDFWERRKERSASPAFITFVEQCIISDCETIPR